MRKVRTELIAHVGGNPTATQRQLIEQVCWLRLHITRMDAKALRSGGFADGTSKQYLAWSNSLERLSRNLGLQGPKQKPKTLADIERDVELRKRQQASAA